MDVLTCSPDRWSRYAESVVRLALLLAMFSSGMTSDQCFMQNSSLDNICKCDLVSVECTDKPDLITSVPLVNGTNIIQLNFGRNGIKEIKENDFSHSEKITEIDLQDNNISIIHKNAFRNQFKLKIINLARNKLTQLDPSGLTFQQLVSLKQLNLESNLISRINKLTFLTMPASIDVTVNLAQNQIACNCSEWVLKNWIHFPIYRSPNKTKSQIKIENLPCNKDTNELPIQTAWEPDFGSCNMQCLQSDTNLMDKGNISWSTGNIGSHTLQCPYSSTEDPKLSIVTRECYINDDGEAEWGSVNDSLCATKYNQTFRAPLSSEIIAASLEEYIDKTISNFTEDTLNLVIVRIEEFKNESLLHKTSVKHLVNGVSKLITAVETTVTEPEIKRNVSRRILAAVDYISENTPLTDGFMKVETPNFAVAASGIDNTTLHNLILTARFTEVNVNFTMGNITELSNTSSIQIPVQAILSSMDPEQRNSQNRVAFVVYHSDTLFNGKKDNAFRETPFENMTQNSFSMKNVSHESQDSKNSKITTKVNSHIIAASIPGFKVHNLSENVTVMFLHNNTNAKNPQCVWWDESLSNGLGNWSDVGCSKVWPQDGRTVCSCNHLTSFALLMDVYHSHVTDQNKWILSIISYVGCGISSVGLFLTFLTFIIFRKFRKENPSKILINLCLSMMLSNLVFLAGMQDYAFSNDISCKAVAVLLHYFLLASLCWMAVEAFYMYLAIVLVFRTYYQNFIFKCALVGWGVPLVVVIVTLAVNSTDNYGSIKSGICWLQDSAFYGAFVGPVCFILLMNFIAFILVLRQIINVTTPKFNKTDRGG